MLQIEFNPQNGGHDSAVQALTVDQQHLYSADWHGNIKVGSHFLCPAVPVRRISATSYLQTCMPHTYADLCYLAMQRVILRLTRLASVRLCM